MIVERAKAEHDDELSMHIEQAKRDYDNAVNRFNNAKTESMINLAVFDMNTAMKRYCFLVENEKILLEKAKGL